MSSGVAGREDDLGDRAMMQATGKTWGEWYEALDTAGAASWSHPQIASWIVDRHGVNGWWAQGVTVGYEQSRGLRRPGQMADGTFSVGASKTMPFAQQPLLDRAVDVLTSALGAKPVATSREAKYVTARWSLEHGESLLAQVNPTSAGRSSVVLTLSRMPTADALPDAKARLRRLLDAIAAGQV
jgi:hypothetical protein